MINEFTILKNASATYRAQAGDTRIKDQIVYWLNCWDDTADAAINYLKAVKAVQDEEANDKIWDLYATGQAAFEKIKKHMDSIMLIILEICRSRSTTYCTIH